MKTYHLHIKGRVQGVGFRPRVFALAKERDLKGSVSNGRDGVHIFYNAEEPQARAFMNDVLEKAPTLSVITAVSIKQVELADFREFSIVESQEEGTVSLKVSPDFGICEACRTEMNDPNDHRHQYAFITCTECGPRYSIMKTLPYDRPNTTMAPFEMCDDCSDEYENPADRRHFSQTNSCPECGISMYLYKGQKRLDLGQKEVIPAAVMALKNGQIAAAKGIGGYLLLCDATNAAVIKRLRLRKNRPEKPLALMYPNLEMLRADLLVTEAEEAQLASPNAPIVILSQPTPVDSDLAMEEIAPGLSRMGVMLPYAPLLALIAQGLKRPLVATSANISGSPIIYKDEEAVKSLGDIADLVLTHDRPILAPQDDSVIRMAADQPILLRRSRGYAPAYYGEMPAIEDQKILALGAQMKGSFALASGPDWQVSQFLGSMEEYDSQLAYLRSLKHLSGLFKFEATQVVTDQHPAYFSHIISGDFKVPVTYVQHHEAHFAAVLQENELIDQPEPILGVIWDGTGWGADENLWGGEFFSYESYNINHLTQLNPVPQLSGDKMAREPRLSALAFFGDHPALMSAIKAHFSSEEWSFFQKQRDQPALLTSSMGRLFDAMASLLGLIQNSSYEGHAAMLLEEAAWKAVGQSSLGYSFAYTQNGVGLEDLAIALAHDLKSKIPASVMALKFHLGLVDLVRQVADYHNHKNLAFAGGVFQNALLVSLLKEQLGAEYTLYFHQQLSPNDESISFGQLAHFFMKQKRKEFLDQNKEAYVFSNSR